MEEESEEAFEDSEGDDFGDDLGDDSPAPVRKKGGPTVDASKRYVKKSPLEHVLLRPDTYVGSIEAKEDKMWVFDEGSGMTHRKCTYVPGLYKIFDEILVNASDNRQRDPKGMTEIRVTVDPDANRISVYNDGQGEPSLPIS